MQDGLQRPKFKVAVVNDDGTFGLGPVDTRHNQARLGVPREELRHPDDVRVSEWMLNKAAKRHSSSLEHGRWTERSSGGAAPSHVSTSAPIESMIEFAASPAAARYYLSGRSSGFVVKRTTRHHHVGNNLYDLCVRRQVASGATLTRMAN